GKVLILSFRTKIEPDGVLDDFRREPIASVTSEVSHTLVQGRQTPPAMAECDKPISSADGCRAWIAAAVSRAMLPSPARRQAYRPSRPSAPLPLGAGSSQPHPHGP